MATADQKSKTLPAYVSYGTFKNFLETLKKSGIPARIDKSVMPGMATGTQGHLTSTLKFLKLIGANGEPQPQLEAMVASVGSENDWPKAITEVVDAAYDGVLKDLALVTATPAQLTERFRENTALDGATLDKALRFFLQAIKEAKIDHSTHLATMKVKTTYSKSQRAARTPTNGAADSGRDESETDEEDEGEMMHFPIYFKGKTTGKISVPETITTDDCKMIAIALQMIEAYAGQQEED